MSGATSVAHALGDTDWALLAEQKARLVQLVMNNAADGCGDPADNEALDGLLHWLDAVQDGAEADGYPVVFLTEEN